METQDSPNVTVFRDSTAMAEEAARRFILLSKRAIAERGSFSVALAGGTTPKLMYELLARKYRSEIDWSKVYMFWGDERFVPHDSPDSTYFMVNEALLKHVPIPPKNVYTVPTVNCTLEEAAQSYTKSLRDHFGSTLACFDLVLLGMGPDGHTASLFPQNESLKSADIVAAVRNSPKPPALRVTLTYKVINAGANIIVMITGSDKAAVLRDVLYGPRNYFTLPIQGVKPLNGKIDWFIDLKASAELPENSFREFGNLN